MTEILQFKLLSTTKIDAISQRNLKFQFDENYIFPSFYNMSQTQMKEYFTDYELSSVVNKTCPLLSQNKRRYYYEQSCCVGSLAYGLITDIWVANAHCVQKIDYTFKLRYPNERKAYNMGDIFWTLKNRSRIIIFGDSLQNQVFNGMTCDLLRNNISLTIISNMNMKMLIKDGNDPNIIRHRDNRTFTAKKLNADNVTVTHMVNILYIRGYHPKLQLYKDFCEWADVYLLNWDLHYILDRTSRRYQRWKREIGSGILKLVEKCFLKHKQQKKQLPIFIWRGTAAQHFSHIGGYYEHNVIYNDPRMTAIENKHLLTKVDKGYREYIVKEYEPLNTGLLTNNTLWSMFLDYREQYCKPMYFANETFENFLWRERLMNYVENAENNISEYEVQVVFPNEKILVHMNANDRYYLYYIPFKEYTNSFWWMHRGHDCTHYCSSPNLWEFIWDEMYRIIASH